MSRLLRMSARIYDGILLLYPPELRHDFGAEMNEIFCEDLEEAWRNCGFRGVFGVWLCAACEILRVAIPGQRTNPAFVVPLIACAFNALSNGAILAGVVSHHPLASNGPLMNDVLEYVLCPGVLTAFTAIVVVRTGKVSVLSLRGSDTCSKSVI